MASEGCVYFLKFCTMRQPEIVGTVSPSSDTGTTHVTLLKVPCCQLSYKPYLFKHCSLLGLKIITVRSRVHHTFYSQNPNTTFKIRFWVFAHDLWRAGSSEHRVIPSTLMKSGWNYPLKHQERGEGEGTSLKDSKFGALKGRLGFWFTLYCCRPKVDWNMCLDSLKNWNLFWKIWHTFVNISL